MAAGGDFGIIDQDRNHYSAELVAGRFASHSGQEIWQCGIDDQGESAICNYETTFRMHTAVPSLVDPSSKTESTWRLYDMHSFVKETAAYGQHCR